jgi:hypothetical protein
MMPNVPAKALYASALHQHSSHALRSPDMCSAGRGKTGRARRAGGREPGRQCYRMPFDQRNAETGACQRAHKGQSCRSDTHHEYI